MGRCQALLARWPRLESAVEAARPYLPPLNFITLHYAYFLLVCLVFTLVFWGASEPRLSISFVDSLFCVVSAMSEAGLNTVNLSQMTTFQQILLLLLIMLGSQIWVSIWTVLARKRAFESRFQDIVRKERERAKSTDKRLDLTINLPIMRSLSRTFGKTQDRTTEPEGEGSGRRPGLALRTATSGSLHISGPVAVERMSKTAAPAASDEKGPDVESTPADAPERGRTADRSQEHISFRGGEKGADANPAPGAAPDTGRLAADRTNHEHISFSEDVGMTRDRMTASVYDANSVFRRRPSRVRETSADSAADPPRPEPSHRQFLTAKTVGRNAQFHDLSTEERELLGGTEYRALKVLSVVVPTYFFLWQVLGCLALGAWISRNLPGPARANDINPWWNGIFNAVSAFNNSGMSVLDANMVPYGGSYFVLVAMGALILAGNTAYPLFLRLWLWALLKLLRAFTPDAAYADLKQTLEYILKYPRRVYTNLFPARATWWLVFMLFVLNGTDWIGFEILNLGNPALGQIPVGSRVIDGLFQALAVRSGGFVVVSISQMYIGLQVLYVVMMYISVYPVVITMRHSNVYEERSLGIYADDVESGEASAAAEEDTEGRPASRRGAPGLVGRALRGALTQFHGVGATAADARAESRISFLSHQVRGQLSHDMWLLVLAVFAISVIETRHFLDDPVTFSTFNILFEVVSAYGTVGISTGLPGAAYSFSGGFYPGSKLVLCLVMLRGRHRGLPVALDRAVRLPGDHLVRDEEEDYRIRRSMSMRDV